LFWGDSSFVWYIIKRKKLSKLLYIIRHGQTDYNKLDIIQGSGINSDLNEFGRKQAELFYSKYKLEGFEVIYTSQLKRAIQSVEGFIKMGIPHKSHYGLNEINWGIMEGKHSDTEQKEMFYSIVREWGKGNLDYAVEGGESPLQMMQRQLEFKEELLLQSQSKILVSSHGRALRGFLCLLTGKPLSDMQLFDHSNLGLYILEQEEGAKFRILKHNCKEHLERIQTL